MDLLKILKVFKHWRRTVLGVACLSFAIVTLAPTPVTHQTTTYKSDAKLLLTPPGVSTLGAGLVGVEMGHSWFARPTILKELLQSEELLARVAEGAGQETSWEDLRGMVEMETLSEGDSGVELFRLSVTADDPKDNRRRAKPSSRVPSTGPMLRDQAQLVPS
jgi:hypothetical protein